MRGLGSLGVPVGHQFYLGLPDGGLGNDADTLDKLVEEIALDIEPGRIFTTGATGYDGHRDHITAHGSVVRTAANLRSLGHEAIVWSLAMDETMGEQIGGDVSRKVGAMAMHSSQRQDSDLMQWGGTGLYTPVIIGPEIYQQLG